MNDHWTVPGYTDVRELGSGTSGRVMLATHDATGTQVAVKYLADKLAADPAFRQAFRAEARLLGGLDSLCVTALYEYVEAPQGAAIVMELVDGVSLRDLLRQEGATTPEAALVVLKGSLLGLASAHRAGVVHRDYKPANVLVTADGHSKLVDFGIATRTGGDAKAAGTPAYMAPEQWRGDPASPSTDVYAATATFYECLTGRRPYSGESFAELVVQHTTAPIPEDDLPAPVRPLVRQGMAKDPQERPENATIFIEELEELAGAAYGPDWEERGRSALAALAALLPLLFPSSPGAPAGTTELATTVLRTSRWTRLPGSWEGAVIGAAALALAGVLAVAVRAGGDDDVATAAESVATTSATPGWSAGPDTEPAAPSPSASPTDTGTEPSPSASPTDDGPEPGGGSSAPTDVTPPATVTPSSAAPSTTEATPPTPSASTAVKSVSVQGLQRVGRTGATSTIEIATSGTGPVTLTVTWYAGKAEGDLGTQDGTPQTFELSGRTQYTVTADHTFQNRGCYWGVLASTTPAAAGGTSQQQIPSGLCGELR
jgi:serine/threonine-protein kinase